MSRNLASLANIDSTSTTLSLNWDLNLATLKVIYNFTDFEGQQQYDSG